ncbi:MAG: hypothetical protein KDJ52_26910 [Anaerolineae bacterium]|nr:hypothetical protein [Anaerolineae bacterium]
MLAMLGLGIVMGIFIVVAILRATMSTDPTGCILIFGSLIFIVVWLVIFIPWWIFGG